MSALKQIEAIAIEVAAELGREWSDCGAYEREQYRDEASRRFYGEE